MADKYYYIGPWVWETRGDIGPYWKAPDNTIGLFDLRGINQEQGFFCTSVPILNSDYTLLGGGNLREHHTNQIQRDAWRDILKLSIEELSNSITNLRDILIKTFEELGDPTGEKRFFPPTATHLRNFELFLGGHNGGPEKNLISRRKFTGKDDPACKNLLPHLRNTYQKYIAQEMSAETEEDAEKIVLARKKVLWNWEHKYPGILVMDFQPDGINEKAVKPMTIITDDFNRGNEELGVSADWTELTGDFEVVSNEVKQLNALDAEARNDNSLSSDDHYSQLDFTANGDSGTLVRLTDTNNWLLGFALPTANQLKLFKRVGGGFTELGVTQSFTHAAPFTLKTEIDGTSLSMFIDGTLRHGPETATEFAGVLTTGIRLDQNITGDNFEAADLAVGGNPLLAAGMGNNMGSSANLMTG